MKNSFVAFWVWNKRKSPMTMSPRRVKSGKSSFNQRVLSSLSGIALYRKAEKILRQSRKGYSK